MNLHMELACCESVIENECSMKEIRQRDVAETYALAMVSSWKTDWGRANRAILKRWPKGLNRVKEMAHKILANRRAEAIARQVASN